MAPTLGDKIVAFIDDRENQGIDTVGQHVAHAFSLQPHDAYTELAELLDAERIYMTEDQVLHVRTEGVDIGDVQPFTKVPL